MEPEVPMTDSTSEGKCGEFSKSSGIDPVEYIWGEGWQRQKDEGQWILHIQNLIKNQEEKKKKKSKKLTT